MAGSGLVTGTWILVTIYAAVILYFVVKGARSIKNISDYAVGSIIFSPVAVGLSLAASMTSAATFVINPGLIANFGWSGFLSFGIFFPLGAIISLVILTKSFRKYGQTTKALTLAQWIGSRYNSKGFALMMAVLSVLLVTFIVLIVVALTKVLSKSLNVDEIYILVVMVSFIFGYMMFGGANSMVYTNTIQALIMVVVAFILLTSGFEHFADGINGLFTKLSAIDPALTQNTNPASPLFRDYFEIIVCQFIVGFAVVCQPHIITKSLLLKKESDVNKYLIVGVVAEVLFFLVVFTGLYARVVFPDLTAAGVALKSDGVIPAYVVEVFQGDGFAVVVGLVVILGLIAAGMSTLEGLIQSLSSTITTDIFKPLFGHKLKSEQSLILVNKVTIIILAIVSAVISWDQIVNPKLSVAILAQNGVYAYFSAAFIPILFGIFLKDVNYKAPLIASITALAVHFGVYYLLPVFAEAGVNFGFYTKYLQGTIRNPAIASSTAIVISTITGFIIYYSTKAKTENE